MFPTKTCLSSMTCNGSMSCFAAQKSFREKPNPETQSRRLSSEQVCIKARRKVSILQLKCLHVGFMTTKGELVRAILFPPPLDFQFHRDFLKSIYVFLTLGLIGMSYSLTMWIRNGVRQKR